MLLEIVTPEGTLFEGDVVSVKVPGVSGEFQILENHAPIATSIVEGWVAVETKGLEKEALDALPENFQKLDASGKIVILPIKMGTLEVKSNKLTILAG